MKKLIVGIMATAILLSGASYAETSKAEQLISEANAAAQSGQLSQAMDKVNAYIKESPQAARGYALRAHINFANDKFENALQDFTKAISIEPRNVRYLVDRGLCHYAMDHDQLAIYDLEMALQINPGSMFAQKMHTRISKELGNEKIVKNGAPLKVKNGTVNAKNGIVRSKQKKSAE